MGMIRTAVAFVGHLIRLRSIGSARWVLAYERAEGRH